MASHIDKQVGSKESYRWFFGAGAFAILLTVALLGIDDYLEASQSERKLAETLHELRTAQARLGTGEVDSRLLVRDLVQKEMSEIPLQSPSKHIGHGSAADHH